jgi:hypothetical protein
MDVYTSAKVTRDYGSAAARALATGNEMVHGNAANERYMDEHNNAVGREIGRRAREENWSDDRIADEVKRSMDSGQVVRDVKDVTPEEMQKNPYFIPESSTTSQPSPSVLDQIGNVLGAAGQGLLTIGNMALNTALSVGKVGIESALTVLARGGQIPMSAQKFLRQNVTKVIWGQILGQLQAKEQSQNVGIWGGPTGPFERDPAQQTMIEKIMNDQANEDFMGKTMQMVMSAVQRGEIKNPLEALIAGIVAGINDALDAQEKKDRAMGKKTANSGPVQVVIFGQPVLVNGGCFGTVLSGGVVLPQVPEGIAGGSAGGGDVQVHAYSRGNGNVSEHTRSRPDGDESNNLSYHSGAQGFREEGDWEKRFPQVKVKLPKGKFPPPIDN